MLDFLFRASTISRVESLHEWPPSDRNTDRGMDCGKAFQVTYIGRATKFFVYIDPFTGLPDEVVGKSKDFYFWGGHLESDRHITRV